MPTRGSTASSSRSRARSTPEPTRSSATSSPSGCSGCRGAADVDFTFSDEQKAMAAAVRELLVDVCSPATLRLAYDADARADGRRWASLVELGLPGILAPETADGLGLRDIDFVLVAEEAGRAALPEPIVEHAGVAVPLLAEIAAQSPVAQALLARTATGECRIAVAHERNPYVLAADE